MFVSAILKCLSTNFIPGHLWVCLCLLGFPPCYRLYSMASWHVQWICTGVGWLPGICSKEKGGTTSASLRERSRTRRSCQNRSNVLAPFFCKWTFEVHKALSPPLSSMTYMTSFPGRGDRYYCHQFTDEKTDAQTYVSDLARVMYAQKSKDYC